MPEPIVLEKGKKENTVGKDRQATDLFAKRMSIVSLHPHPSSILRQKSRERNKSHSSCSKTQHSHSVSSDISSSHLSVYVYRLPPPVLGLRPKSMLPRKLSMLGRRELELERRRRWRSSSGSLGERPLARAKRLRTSVRLTTPVRRPLRFWPGSWEAEMAVPGPMLEIDEPGEAFAMGSSRVGGRLG